MRRLQWVMLGLVAIGVGTVLIVWYLRAANEAIADEIRARETLARAQAEEKQRIADQLAAAEREAERLALERDALRGDAGGPLHPLDGPGDFDNRIIEDRAWDDDPEVGRPDRDRLVR